jgi:hypothetical protein
VAFAVVVQVICEDVRVVTTQLLPPISTVAFELIFFPLIVKVSPPLVLPLEGEELVIDKLDFPPPLSGLHPARRASIKNINVIL